MPRRTKTQQRAIDVALRLQFTEREREEICRAAAHVWDELAYDVLTDGGERKENNARTIRRAEVIELVCDADRLEEQISDPQLRARVRTMDYQHLIALLETEFTYQRYGL